MLSAFNWTRVVLKLVIYEALVSNPAAAFNWTRVVLKLVIYEALVSNPAAAFNWTRVVLKPLRRAAWTAGGAVLLIGPEWY